MRKILAVLTVLVFGLVLVACSPDTSEIDTFLSPNKIVYTMDETNANGPIIETGDFECRCATHMLPLPIDQRYSLKDMERLLKYTRSGEQ